MKYKALLKILRVLIYFKRFLWWLGARIYFVLAKIALGISQAVIYIRYKIGYFFRRVGFSQSREWVMKRGFLQTLLFIALFFVLLSQTKFFPKVNASSSGRKTLAYGLLGVSNETDQAAEEIIGAEPTIGTDTMSWKAGVVDATLLNYSGGASGETRPIRELSRVMGGGTAIGQPIIIDTTEGAAVTRDQVTEYTIALGDSLGKIAQDFGVSVATIIWENNLSVRTLLQPGDLLKIPPVTGVMHTVKKKDTLAKIAALYDASVTDIVSFNHLKPNGTNLKIGDRIMIPEGVKPKEREMARVGRGAPKNNGYSTLVSRAARPSSVHYLASGAGFIWPSASHIITQYFNWRHTGVDIAGAWETPSYAAREGVVETSQCGWNGGYGCYVIIDHGDGVKTLYGHHSKLLVTAGEEVSQGQAIALMGNTGNVRGATGIHLHFEIRVNGARVNPLGYIR